MLTDQSRHAGTDTTPLKLPPGPHPTLHPHPVSWSSKFNPNYLRHSFFSEVVGLSRTWLGANVDGALRA